MASPHKSSNYTKYTAELKNPFIQGQDKAFAEILVDKQKEVSFWRLTAIGVLIFTAINLLLFFSALNTQKTVPVLVNVMPSGEAQYLGEVHADSMSVTGGIIQVPESAFLFQCREFITLLRSVSIDPEVLYNNIDKSYALVTGNYEPIMTRNLRADSPFNMVGKIRRTVEIESVIKITGSSYQADWTENNIQNGSQKKSKMRAVITLKQLPVSNATIKNNPLGIYIDNFEMISL